MSISHPLPRKGGLSPIPSSKSPAAPVLVPVPVTAPAALQKHWEPSDCIRCDLEADSRVLMISFAGNATDMLGATLFEFVKLTADIPVKKVYLRDPANLWFQTGIPGVGNSPDALCRYLRKLRDDNGIERVVIIGSSAGGFAAILFGLLMGADEIHAFGPQTRLRTPTDSCSPERVAQLNRLQTPEATYLDLRKVALTEQREDTSVFVHYDAKDVRDNGHARYVADLPGFHLVRHPVGGHAVATVLKHTGALKRLLQRALVGDSPISRMDVIRGELRVYPKWLMRSLVKRFRSALPAVRLPQGTFGRTRERC